METELQKRVLKCKVNNIENAYIAVSAKWLNELHEGIKKNMSLFYVIDDSTIVEWEPEYGPITLICKCDKDWDSGNDYEKAEAHWYFDYCTGYGYWTQLAVDEYKLHEHFINGDYEYIFNVLKQFGE